MIIKKLTFQNFKSFGDNAADQNLTDLDVMSLIYGDNNSGKSNVLRLIELLFKKKIELSSSFLVSGQTLTPEEEVSPFWRGKIVNDAFLFHKNDRSKNITFDVTLGFKTSEISSINNAALIIADLHLSDRNFDMVLTGSIRSLVDPYESEMVLESAHINGEEIYRLQSGSSRYFNAFPASALLGDSVTFENLMGLLNDCVVFLDHNRFLNKENEDGNARTLKPNKFKNWLHNMTLDQVNYSNYEKFVTFIQTNSVNTNSLKVLKEFDPTYAKKGGEIDVFLKTNSERLPINSFGTGVMQILLLLSTIFDTSSRIVLIEELELNLSPKVQQELLQLLTNIIGNKEIDQVIFTSHSDILGKAEGLSVYKVQIADGVSGLQHMENAEEEFYQEVPQIREEISIALREYGVKGPEWD